MIVVLPFEESIYREANVPCNFVGHPLLDSMAPQYDKAEIRKQFELPEDALILGILPGSRYSEIQSLLPPMMEAVSRIKHDYPDVHCVIGQAPTVPEEWINEVIDRGKIFRDPHPQPTKRSHGCRRFVAGGIWDSHSSGSLDRDTYDSHLSRILANVLDYQSRRDCQTYWSSQSCG